MKSIINSFKMNFECVHSWIKDLWKKVENICFTTHVDEVGSFDTTLNYFIYFSNNWNIGPS
jgi:hypothetical protein